jgi:hypothetical protein
LTSNEYNARRRPDGRLWLALVAVIAVWALLYGIGHASTHRPVRHHHAKALAPPHVKKAFYYNLTPRQGGQACLVGPWNTLSACRDNLGSAQRAHPFACHISGPAGGNCRDLGNGYGYTKTMPSPPTWPVPDNDCQLIPLIHTHERGKWVRFWYSDVGDCTVVIKGKPQPVLPAGAFTYYADSQCPGYPWIYIGDRPDQVCN